MISRIARKPAIGMVGVGKMGLPICLQLVRAGFAVTVLPSPRQRAQGEIAATLAQVASAAALAAVCDVLITCLPSSQEVEDALHGPCGFFAGMQHRAAMVHIDHSSGDPQVSRRLAEQWRARGGCFIDAAISGTPERARQGQLKLLVGGDAAALEAVRAIAAAYTDQFIAAGPVGSGHMLRLIGGAIGYGIAALSSEAVAMCHDAGIAPAHLHAMVTGSGADSATFQAILAAELPGDHSSPRQLSLASVYKDLVLLLKQAGAVDCAVPLLARLVERMGDAYQQAGDEALVSDLSRHFQSVQATFQRG